MNLSGLRFEQPTVDTSRLSLPHISFEQPTARTTRARDPISDTWTLKTGLSDSPILFVDSAAVTESVTAGGIVDVAIEVVNAASSISGDDPDQCQAGSGYGFRYDVVVEPSWTDSESDSKCLGYGGIGSNRESHTFDFTAPEEGGSYEVDVTVETPSGEGGTESYSVAVSDDSDGSDDGSDDDSDIRPGPGDDDESSGDGPLDGVLGDGDLLSGLSGPVALLVVILLLFIIGSVAFRASPLGVLLN